MMAMRRGVLWALVAVLLTWAVGCACGECENPLGQKEVQEAPKPRVKETVSEPVEPDDPLESWDAPKLATRIDKARWRVAGECKEVHATLTCEVSRGSVHAKVVLVKFNSNKKAVAHIQEIKSAGHALHREGESVLHVELDPLKAATDLHKTMVGDGTTVDLSEWGSRTLLVHIKNAGWEPNGVCSKSYDPGIVIWTCKVSNAGLTGTVKLELVAGGVHTSDSGKKIPGSAVLDQGDAALIVTIETIDGGQELLDALVDG